MSYGGIIIRMVPCRSRIRVQTERRSVLPLSIIQLADCPMEVTRAATAFIYAVQVDALEVRRRTTPECHSEG